MENKKYTKTYFDVIEERFSCRNFTADKITTDELKVLIEAGRVAPTAVNFQPQKLIVVENPTLLERLKEATRFTFDAKTILVVCYNEEESWHRHNDGKDHGDIDCAICATQIMLAATAMGLGTCYVCSFKEPILKDILDIPANYKVSCLLPVGYPKEVVPHNTRKDVEEFVVYK